MRNARTYKFITPTTTDDIHLTASHGLFLNERLDVRMALHTAKETALGGVLPDDDTQLVCVVYEELVVCLRCECGVQIT